eukprot:s2897_g6.t2
MSGTLAAITASTQLRRWSHALDLLESSRHLRLKPSAALYTAAIDACGAGGRWATALKLFDELQSMMTPDVACFGAVIAAFSTGAVWERCLSTLTSMSEWRIDVNIACATEAVAASCTGQRMKISTRCRHVLVWLLLGCTEAIKVTVTLPAKEKKCFGEQAARMELLFVELSVADGSKVGVTVLSPHATIFSEHDRQQVKTAFTTQEAGPHWVCIQNDAPSAAEVLLTVLLGPEAKDYSQVAKKEHLEESQIALRRVEESLRNYHSNVLYIRAREERMRQTNDSTASRVIFFCLFNVFLMIGVGGWQMLYFKRFFRLWLRKETTSFMARCPVRCQLAAGATAAGFHKLKAEHLKLSRAVELDAMALRTLEWLSEETLSSRDLICVKHGVSHVLLNGWKLDLGALVVLFLERHRKSLHRPVFELVALLDASHKRGHSGIAAEYIGITDLGPMPTCDAVEISNMCVPGAARDRASAEAGPTAFPLVM